MTRASHRRSTGSRLPLISITPLGSTASARAVAVPTWATAAPWSTIVRPTDATRRVTEGELRRWRNTRV